MRDYREETMQIIRLAPLIGNRITGVLLGIASVVLISLVWVQIAQSEPKKGGTLVVAHASMPHINPAIGSGYSIGIPGIQVFASLVKLDENFKAHPYVAEGWDVSEDGLTWTFHIRDGVRFHDGKPLTSADVAFSLEVVKANHPFGKAMFDAVETVETPDPKTAVFRLKNKHPALTTALSSVLMPILPKHVYETGESIRQHPANTEPIGAGPYKFVEWKKGEYLLLERNEDYFLEGKPYLDRIIFKMMKDPLSRRLALERGEVDYSPFSGFRAVDIVAMQKNEELVGTTKGYEAIAPVNYIEMNLRNPPLSDQKVRAAIAHAVDKAFIVDKLLMGTVKAVPSHFHSTSPFYTEAVPTYEHDLDKANSLLDEAGYKKDANGTRFGVTIDYPRWHPDSLKSVAEYMKPQLAKIGIDVTLRPSTDFATFAKRVGDFEYEIVMNSTWNYPDPVIGVHRHFLSDNIRKGVVWSNTQAYINEEVDTLLARAAVEQDFDKRKALYHDFQQIISSDLPFIWTNEEPYVTFYRKGVVQNPPLTVWGALAPFDDVYVEK